MLKWIKLSKINTKRCHVPLNIHKIKFFAVNFRIIDALTDGGVKVDQTQLYFGRHKLIINKLCLISRQTFYSHVVNMITCLIIIKLKINLELKVTSVLTTRRIDLKELAIKSRRKVKVIGFLPSGIFYPLQNFLIFLFRNKSGARKSTIIKCLYQFRLFVPPIQQ